VGILDRLRSMTTRTQAGTDTLAALRDARQYGNTGAVSVTQATALRVSAVWACVRLRADLISTLPVDVFRRVGGVQVEVQASPLLTEPSPGMDMVEWLYSTQVDLDRYGNAFGIITARDALGLPRSIELLPAGDVTVRVEGGRIAAYRVGSEKFAPGDIWHERQFTVAGAPMGLCPVANAAFTIGGYLSAQRFALDYFAAGGAPSGVLRHTALEKLDPAIREEAKRQFRIATSDRGIFVTGKDWEWTAAAAPEAAGAFIEEMKFGAADICRFFGVPADMIDAGTSGSAVTYANVTQRNLQFLIQNLGPAVIRRERKLSGALPQPRYVKLNSDALLRMDPATRSQMLAAQVAGRLLTPSEAREMDNRAPYTDEQLAEFDRMFGTRNPAPATAPTPPGASA
jgi:HK97 family phage portal protein